MPAGTLIIPSFYKSLHDPEVYPEPNVFKSERWLNETSLANSNPKHYLAFWAGAHRCIGEQLTNLNMALVLCKYRSLHYGLGAHLDAGWLQNQASETGSLGCSFADFVSRINLILFPKHGCIVKIMPRNDVLE